MGLRRKRNDKLTVKNRLIALMQPKSPISEQYRTIRTNIQFSAVDSDLCTITVSSAGPGEGKTTTISNLAVVFAQQGKRVLLVDCDLRKPMIHNVFQKPNTLGLTNVLTKQIDAAKAIHETAMENLFVMTSGPIPPNPAELLGSASMEAFIKEVTAHFDLVLFDTPPVLAVADAQIMANQTDASILVVSSGNTDRDGAMKAKETLASAKGRLLGAVLNNKELENGADYYYYYSYK